MANGLLSRASGFYRHLTSYKVPYLRIGKNISEYAICWAEWRPGTLYDWMEKKAYTVPADIPPVTILDKYKPRTGFVVDDDKGTAVRVEKHGDLLRMVGNPELHGSILDSGMINNTYRITPSGREIWVQRIVFAIIGALIGSSL